jgi:hypothetical protein
MLYFPQLLSGAAAQFPVRRSLLTRTIVNTADDGRTVKLADPGSQTVEWELDLRGLAGQEWNAIQSLFQAVEGRLKSFTFLDPTDNLLAWSEDLSAAVWSKDPALQFSANVSDPKGTLRATRITNPTQSPLPIQQACEVPGWFQYCLSVYARSEQPAEINLVRSSAGGTEKKTFRVGPGWQRVEYSSKPTDSSELVSFGMEIPGSAAVDVFGFQLESQTCASMYKKTVARHGVYREAWFQEDALSVETEGPDRHSCRLRIGARS